MDSFDDFEFKPLTEGLGFHKKADKPVRENFAPIESEMISRTQSALNTQTENELLGRESHRPTSKSISDLIASLPPSLDFIGGDETEQSKAQKKNQKKNHEKSETTSRPQIFQPFARENFKAGAATIGEALASTSAPNKTSAAVTKTPPPAPLSATLPKPGSKAVTSAFKPPAGATSAPQVNSLYRDQLKESFARAFPHAERKIEPAVVKEAPRRREIARETPGLIATDVHFGSGVLDAMVVTGMSMILLVAIVGITHVNLLGLLTNARTDGPTQVHIALLFLACLQLYLLTARSFFGASLGEWAFDLQLGTDEDRVRTIYPLQVAWRSLIVTLTGIILLPLISFVFRRDVVKFLTGLQLFRRQT